MTNLPEAGKGKRGGSEDVTRGAVKKSRGVRVIKGKVGNDLIEYSISSGW